MKRPNNVTVGNWLYHCKDYGVAVERRPTTETVIDYLRQSSNASAHQITQALEQRLTVAALAAWQSVNKVAQCDSCGKLDMLLPSIPAAGVMGGFCHSCRHGKDCQC